MKNILFLLLVLCFNLFGYEYLYESFQGGNNLYEYYYYDNVNGKLRVKQYENNELKSTGMLASYNGLGSINVNASHYVTKEVFLSYLRNDNQFLNDWYTQYTNEILNLFYNVGVRFSNDNYVQYEYYEILYNQNGYAVESIVNGVWAGLYDNKEESGFLYNSTGQLKYKNGVELTGVNLLVNLFIVKILNAFNDIDWNSIKLIPVIVLTLSLFFFLLSKFKGVFRGRFKSFN